MWTTFPLLALLFSCLLVGRAAAQSEAGNSGELASQLMHRALHHAVWGPPAFCTVRQRIQVFDRQVSSSSGKFIRVGGGSGKLKLSLQFPAGDSMNTLLQISDGQRLHTIENFGDETQRSIIDLDKVRSRLVINNESVSDPTIAMYLAIGGQAESLRKLCQQYQWTSVKPGTYGEQATWVLTGILAETPPAIRAAAESDIFLQSKNVSGLLPTQVRVAIARTEADDPLQYWLYRVEQRRAEADPSSSERREKLLLVTEWADPKLIQQSIGKEVFEAAQTTGAIIDETRRYLPPEPRFARLPTNLEALKIPESVNSTGQTPTLR